MVKALVTTTFACGNELSEGAKWANFHAGGPHIKVIVHGHFFYEHAAGDRPYCSGQ